MTPKRKSIVWNYQSDGTAKVSAILSEKLMNSTEASGFEISDNNGVCISLNYTGTKIWELCDGINTVEDIINSLSQEFGIGKEELISDVDGFFKYCDSVDIIDANWRSVE